VSIDSPFSKHPNFSPKTDAAVAAWVLATQRKDWAAMTEAEQGSAYVDYFVSMSDDDCADMLRRDGIE
jgi:hypothetical protein